MPTHSIAGGEEPRSNPRAYIETGPDEYNMCTYKLTLKNVREVKCTGQCCYDSPPNKYVASSVSSVIQFAYVFQGTPNHGEA